MCLFYNSLLIHCYCDLVRWAYNDGDDDDDAGGHSERDSSFYSGPGLPQPTPSTVLVVVSLLYSSVLLCILWIHEIILNPVGMTLFLFGNGLNYSQTGVKRVLYRQYSSTPRVQVLRTVLHTGITNMNSGWFKPGRFHPFRFASQRITAFFQTVKGERGLPLLKLGL